MVESRHIWQCEERLGKEEEAFEQAEKEAQEIGQNTRVRVLKEEINILLDREACMWSQRSRTLWLRNGDKNTRFFSLLSHSKVQEKFNPWDHG